MSGKRLRLRTKLFLLPDDLQLEIMSHLDPLTLAILEHTCRAVRKITDSLWARLVTSFFQCTLLNPPVLDPSWTARTKFRYLFHFEGPQRPLWAWRMSTEELMTEVRSLITNAYPSFWDSQHGDYELIDELCQTLRHLVPDFGLQPAPTASVDMPFEAFVGLLVMQIRELAQRGVVAQPWMFHVIQPGDVLHHLEAVDMRRDFWRVMSITNGVLLLQPLGAAADAQGRWNSFPRIMTRSQLFFDYFMTQGESAGCGTLAAPAWHSAQRRLSWEFSLLMVYNNDDV